MKQVAVTSNKFDKRYYEQLLERDIKLAVTAVDKGEDSSRTNNNSVFESRNPH